MENQEYEPLIEEDEEDETLSASFETFKSQISNSVILLLAETEPESETLCVSWIQGCLKLIPEINNAFTDLVLDIDYPMSKWTIDSADEYMNCSLHILNHLNLISSTISQLGHARLFLSHALSLMAIDRLKPIKPVELGIKDHRILTGDNRGIPRSKHEAIIHQAMKSSKKVGFWICGVVLSILSGDPKPYMEIKKMVSGFSDSFSNLGVLDAVMERKMILKEMKEVNEAVDRLGTAIESGEHNGEEEAEELQRKLEEFERKIGELGKEVDGVFSNVLDGRNQMLDSIRIS